VSFEILSVIGQSCEFGSLNVMQRVGQAISPVPMVVAVRFAVCGDMHQLILLAPVVECAHQPIRKRFPAR
jgi:hypothetical protein